jgi:hypothetical protein
MINGSFATIVPEFAKCTTSVLNSVPQFFCVVCFATLFKQVIKYKKILNKNEIIKFNNEHAVGGSKNLQIINTITRRYKIHNLNHIVVSDV